VASRDERALLIVDLTERSLVGKIALPAAPGIGATKPDGLKLYVPLAALNKVAVVDIRTRRVIKLIDDVGTRPWTVQLASQIAFCH
jgi:YVTN family beta-propeller protein